MDHVIEDVDGLVTGAEAAPDLGRVWMTAELGADGALRFTKFLAYGWSSQRSLPSVRDQVAAAVASARRTGWDALAPGPARLPRRLLGARRRRDRRRRRAPAGRPVRALPRAPGGRAGRAPRDPGQGPDRPGLRRPRVLGHRDAFVLPLLTYTQPRAAADALRWRHETLDLALERAKTLGLTGAAFPWRTIRGQECSAYWPAGTAGFHINADIADAVDPLPAGRPATRTSRPGRASSCWCRRRGCGARSATTTTPARSTSTASPAPTSTRRWPTTTSTRT